MLMGFGHPLHHRDLWRNGLFKREFRDDHTADPYELAQRYRKLRAAHRRNQVLGLPCAYCGLGNQPVKVISVDGCYAIHVRFPDRDEGLCFDDTVNLRQCP